MPFPDGILVCVIANGVLHHLNTAKLPPLNCTGLPDRCQMYFH